MHEPALVFPALKLRLVACIFNPYLLVPNFVFLTTVWGLAAFQASQVSNDRSGCTTNTVTTTIPTVASTTSIFAMSSTLASSVTPTRTLKSSPQFELHIDNYLSAKATDSAQILNSAIEYYTLEMDSILENWNSSVQAQLTAWQQHYESLKQYNDTIFSNLGHQAQNIARSVNYLTTNGFLVTTGDIPNVLDSLKLNMTDIKILFENVTSSLTGLKSMHHYNVTKRVNLPQILPDRVLTQWLENDKYIQKAKGHLMNGLKQSFNQAQAKALNKRSEPKESHENYRSKCIRLSCIFVSVHACTILLLMYREYLGFRIEMFRLRQTIEAQIKCIEDCACTVNMYKARLRVRGPLQDLLLSYTQSTSHPIAGVFDELLEEHVFSKRPRKKRLINAQVVSKIIHWWLVSNGPALWTLFISFFIEGQVVLNILADSDSYPDRLSKRTFVTHRGNNDLIIGQINALCREFEQEVNSRLNATAFNALWGSGNGTVPTAYAKMRDQLHYTKIPVQLTSPHIPSQLDSVPSSFTNLSSMLASSLLASFSCVIDTDDHSMYKRQMANPEHPYLTNFKLLHRRSCYSLIGIVGLHHLAGILVALSSPD
ncbi:LADA_0A05776g1_1 [Lachancea dasiensis]|uniref:LADA_0A05776g1_1 n=1 Tax=Lachancea dasiensis TaxID=1072105 RepID=A0A1G4IP55_9SACH|nr:LADA_0A05776g1_1 [Lachancea dasiensis]